jgi:hypothetical protein
MNLAGTTMTEERHHIETFPLIALATLNLTTDPLNRLVQEQVRLQS